MKTITLTPEEYITFCLIMQQPSYNNVKINTTFQKNSVMITAPDGFLAELGY